MTVSEYLDKTIKENGAAFFILIDPDKTDSKVLNGFVEQSHELGVDGLLLGSSLALDDNFNRTVKDVTERSKIPVVLFPGGTAQVSPYADAILFLSLISGRNPQYLIGEHVKAAPSIRASGLEVISTGYLLIESGAVSTTEFISNTRAIPRDKPEIALAHSLAAKYIGMKYIYLEAGSGAPLTVPEDTISLIKKNVEMPLIVGGGIKDPETAGKKVTAGADVIVIGNHLENNWDHNLIKDFASAIHQ